MKELLTLQFGNVSNFTMAHYWNLQDEQLKFGELSVVDPTVLFFESASEQRYPFALVFGENGTFGNFSSAFGIPTVQLAQASQDSKLW